MDIEGNAIGLAVARSRVPARFDIVFLLDACCLEFLRCQRPQNARGNGKREA